MRRISDTHIQLESATEARILSKVWAYDYDGTRPEAGRLLLAHSGCDAPTNDEQEFFRRDQVNGPITLHQDRLVRMAGALASIEARGIDHMGVGPATASQVQRVVCTVLAQDVGVNAFAAFEADVTQPVTVTRIRSQTTA